MNTEVQQFRFKFRAACDVPGPLTRRQYQPLQNQSTYLYGKDAADLIDLSRSHWGPRRLVLAGVMEFDVRADDLRTNPTLELVFANDRCRTMLAWSLSTMWGVREPTHAGGPLNLPLPNAAISYRRAS